MRWLAKPEVLARVEAEHAGGCTMCNALKSAEPIACSFSAIGWPEYEALHRLAWQLCRAIEVTQSPVRIFVASLGSAQPLATSFPHIHLHIVPLSDGGEVDRPANVFTWTHGMYVFESASEERELLATLRAALPEPA